MSHFDDVLRVLDRVKACGDGYTARCPAHDDGSSSLSIKPKGDGDYLAKCFTGCSFQDIRAAIEAKGVTREAPQRGAPTKADRKLVAEVKYEIRNAAGELQCIHARQDFDDRRKRFWFEMPTGERRLTIPGTSLLFGAELLAQHPADPVVIVEGEKAALALRSIGVPCVLSTVGASIIPDAAALEALRGRTVWLWPDNDDPGRAQGAALAARLLGVAQAVRIATWAAAPPKGDAADFVAGGGTLEAFRDIARGAVLAAPELPRSVSRLGARDVVLAVLAREDGRFLTGRFPGAIPTGWDGLSASLRGGWLPGEIYLLGAPTGSGKTTALQAFAVEASRHGAVLYVTPEMTIEALVEREITRRCGVPEFAQAKRHAMESTDGVERRSAAAKTRIDAANELMADPPNVLIYDRADATMSDIVETANATPGIALLVIDYAQQVADMNDKPRYLQVGDVANRSVEIAKSLRIPVLLASQVNVAEGKGGKTYSFREAQILEHKASWSAIIEREDEDDGKQRKYSEAVNARLLVRKNRHGQAGTTVDLSWWPALYTMEERKAQAEEMFPVPHNEVAEWRRG